MGKGRYSKRSDSEIYFYVRRVPRHMADLDGRKVIRESLGTRSENEAATLSAQIDKDVEAYWAALLAGHNPTDSRARYEAAIALARSLGFVYRSAADIVKMGPAETMKRLKFLEDKVAKPKIVEAVMGTAPGSVLTLHTLVSTYLEKNKVDLIGKSPAQYRKHKEQREGSVAVAVRVIGDKQLADITNYDTMMYRQHWADRVAAGEVTRESANRSMSDVKGMLTVIDDAYKTEFGKPWEGLRIRGKKKVRDKRRRHPYPLDFVQNRLLAPGALDGMNEDARYSTYGMVETGMGPSEICNLRPEDIVLDHPIPHVRVAERDDREQKTVYRIREVPLVGVSLWAFQQRPQGFIRYRDRGTALSAVINKYLKENGLKPSPQHSVYSLRHTFQDRLVAAGAVDRLQVDLMGHELGRQEYGAGATLEQKRAILQSIKFEWSATLPTRKL
ncbi:MAG TPA: DUF6538 domain-containing protein [Devosia sp.]|nr:DUF6538 domain-containing protein [Devosia sp.]